MSACSSTRWFPGARGLEICEEQKSGNGSVVQKNGGRESPPQTREVEVMWQCMLAMMQSTWVKPVTWHVALGPISCVWKSKSILHFVGFCSLR